MNLQISQNVSQKAGQRLREFLAKGMSASEFEALPDTLGITRKRWGRYLNTPQLATREVIIGLSRAIGTTPAHLIEQFAMGYDSHTASELLITAHP